MQRLKIDRLIIVEGKYDKIHLENLVDADIFVINGFSIYNNGEMKRTLKELAKDKGVIILTDSDTAGYKIRVYLSQILGDVDVVNILAPQIVGKEKRKKQYSAQGYLGIEGIDGMILYNLLSQYIRDGERRKDITHSDLYTVGILGTSGAKNRKNDFLKKLGVQQNISNNFMLKLINEKYTKLQFYKEFGVDLTEGKDA